MGPLEYKKALSEKPSILAKSVALKLSSRKLPVPIALGKTFSCQVPAPSPPFHYGVVVPRRHFASYVQDTTLFPHLIMHFPWQATAALALQHFCRYG